MTTNLFLTPDQIHELTGAKQKAAQINALNFIGVRHSLHPDGSILVFYSTVQKLFGADIAEELIGNVNTIEPDWVMV